MSTDKRAFAEEVRLIADGCGADRIFLVTDSNVEKIEAGLIASICPEGITVIPAGEANKNLREVERVLRMLSEHGATRRSILICVGGGMVTDLGGFAAAIFKRGIRHINVSTTLLGAVDAAVGGKTGVDFSGLKNEIGAFHLPVAVLADAGSFATLPPAEILSGFGEVVKTAMIASGDMTRSILGAAPLEADRDTLDRICRFCRDEKMRIVEADPTEKGLRKVLNLGHTAGHAMESMMLERGCGVPHGTAVAHGLLVGLILSHMECGLNAAWVSRYAAWLRGNYPLMPFTCADYERLWELARHDKKNVGADGLDFVLLSAPGEPHIDINTGRRKFESALDIYQELQGR